MSTLTLFLITVGIQGFLIFWDEFFYHHRRDLPLWERIGHPLDTFFVLIPFAWFAWAPYPGETSPVLIGLMLFSCLLIVKDEGVHAKLSPPGEHKLHAFLFMIHPLTFITGWMLWREQGPTVAHRLQLILMTAFFIYQIFYWNFFRKPSHTHEPEINNELYHDLGERWYEAKDDPVALLRAEAKTKNPWVVQTIQNQYAGRAAQELQVLDIACGAGFLANDLARAGYKVHGVDLSESSLAVAAKHDETRSVNYQPANAYALPFANASFEVVTCMDFLEHVDDPAKVVAEASRVLKPGGIFIFHTFNRNPLAHFVVIKGMEWFVKNTPPHLHVIRMFVKPKELKNYCSQAGLQVTGMSGIAPRMNGAFFKMLRTGIVPDDFGFRITRSTLMSYIGVAAK